MRRAWRRLWDAQVLPEVIVSEGYEPPDPSARAIPDREKHEHSFGPWSSEREGQFPSDGFYQTRDCRLCNLESSRCCTVRHRSYADCSPGLRVWSDVWRSSWGNRYQKRTCACGRIDVTGRGR